MFTNLSMSVNVNVFVILRKILSILQKHFLQKIARTNVVIANEIKTYQRVCKALHCKVHFRCDKKKIFNDEFNAFVYYTFVYCTLSHTCLNINVFHEPARSITKRIFCLV